MNGKVSADLGRDRLCGGGLGLTQVSHWIVIALGPNHFAGVNIHQPRSDSDAFGNLLNGPFYQNIEAEDTAHQAHRDLESLVTPHGARCDDMYSI